MSIKISGCIITHDEEQYIERAVTNLKNYVDEIVIVDSGSTDNTVAICESLGCKVFYRKFDCHYSNQRNYALSMCSNDCVVMIDADEYFDEKVLNSLQLLFEKAIQNNIGVYLVQSHSYLDEKFLDIRLQRRILRKNVGLWEGQIHEGFIPYIGYTCSVLPDDYILYHKKTLRKQLYNNLLYLNIKQGIYERPSYDKGMYENFEGQPILIENQRNNTAPIQNYFEECQTLSKNSDIGIEKYYNAELNAQLKDHLTSQRAANTTEEKLESVSAKLNLLKRRK